MSKFAYMKNIFYICIKISNHLLGFCLFFMLTLFLNTNVYGQENLVPNGDFEEYIECPFAMDLEAFCTSWKNARISPDYYNPCATTWMAGVPINRFGYQEAFSGSAYIGMATYGIDNYVSEAASVRLIQPLAVGVRYYISYKTSLTLSDFAEQPLTANNKIGILFSTIEYSRTSYIPINNRCHFCVDTVIIDTLNWTFVKGSFVPDSAYTHMNLGNFFDMQFADTISYGTSPIAYYYFDDIRVSTDSNYSFQTVGINDPSGYFSVYPNPLTDYFVIKNDITNNPYDLSIYNPIGQLLFSEEKITDSNKNIACNDFNTNFLIIKINTNNQTFYRKLLKQ